jgi:hypothetical protein
MSLMPQDISTDQFFYGQHPVTLIRIHRITRKTEEYKLAYLDFSILEYSITIFRENHKRTGATHISQGR